jgi:hypothetical protein
LDETIWSLTSPRVKRISGFFSIAAPKRLLQQYLPKAEIGNLERIECLACEDSSKRK